jgi:uncharacterized membrane protein
VRRQGARARPAIAITLIATAILAFAPVVAVLFGVATACLSREECERAVMSDEPEEPGPGQEHTGGVERLMAFSDGVFAIAITLLVLPLAEVDLRDNHVTEDLIDVVPSFLTFALSFAVIGRFWFLHHRGFSDIIRTDGTLLVLNLLFLFWVALLPFPTAVLGRYGDTTAGVVLYAVSIIATGLSSAALWWYAARGRTRRYPGALPLIRAETDPVAIRVRLARGAAAWAGFVPSIPLAFVSPQWAELSWLLVIPFSSLTARRR